MNDKDFFQALVEGKKLTHINWVGKRYIHLKDGDLLFDCGTRVEITYLLGAPNDFQIYTEPKTFLDALTDLYSKGSGSYCIRRKFWQKDLAMKVYYPDDLRFYSLNDKEPYSRPQYWLNIEDYKADDWEIVDAQQ